MSTPRSYGRLAVSVALLATFAYAAYEIQTWLPRSRLFGNTIIVPALVLALAQVAREVRRSAERWTVPVEAVVRRSSIAWFVAFFAAVALIGLLWTIPLYSAAYIRLAGRESWPKAVGYAVVAWSFAYFLFGSMLHVPFPTGLIPPPAGP